ncbi:2-amino-4-hydroxy-6- hydroxymethyldihydropteridin e pyrophosphokinase [Bifidobacterium dolichotidis]|uniref:2-amino-4-hydroxy-6-hydroxymethyldihydropteridin e pyrophosphokinase n=1 Tax=Bifidobacterium dolichotidis TaxID=2306976 RepID=A0A430FPX4_9BIFI|nr:hypothetical protein [Bifidobacterium dolichotidis]RSX54887.1 2-amino-4-hydroxy-6- hydroxymethyldihydropteridin e pyrophosphokinase [Bifidobacterium dolichotidis]
MTSRKRTEPIQAGPFLIEAEWEQDDHGAHLDVHIHVAQQSADEVGASFSYAVPASVLRSVQTAALLNQDPASVQISSTTIPASYVEGLCVEKETEQHSLETESESNTSEEDALQHDQLGHETESSTSDSALASTFAEQQTSETPSLEIATEAEQRVAIVLMESASENAATLFRKSIVSIDAVPTNTVEGISPLYHVTNYDSLDTSTAVLQLRTKLSPQSLQRVLSDLAIAHEGQVALQCVAYDGVGTDKHQLDRAAVLAPWMDMDPNGEVDGDPLPFKLAMAQDSMRVAMVSNTWLLQASAESYADIAGDTTAHKPDAFPNQAWQTEDDSEER